MFRGINRVIGFRKGVLDAKVYERLHDKHIEMFGQNDTTKQWIECKKRLIELRTERVFTGNVFLENYIAIEEQKLEDLKKIKGMTTMECLSLIATRKGVAVIHKKDVTVVEFESLMSEYVRATSKKK
jgi:hypothetical protein